MSTLKWWEETSFFRCVLGVVVVVAFYAFVVVAVSEEAFIIHEPASQPVSQQASDSSCYFTLGCCFQFYISQYIHRCVSLHFTVHFLFSSSFEPFLSHLVSHFLILVSGMWPGVGVLLLLLFPLYLSHAHSISFTLTYDRITRIANDRWQFIIKGQLQHVDISLECFRSLSFHNIIMSYRYCY